MQIQLEGAQAAAVAALIVKHTGEPVLFTAQGTDVYAAFETASYTVAANGGVTDEVFD